MGQRGSGRAKKHASQIVRQSEAMWESDSESIRCDAIAWQNLLIRRIEIVLGGAIWKICTTNFTRIFWPFFC